MLFDNIPAFSWIILVICCYILLRDPLETFSSRLNKFLCKYFLILFFNLLFLFAIVRQFLEFMIRELTKNNNEFSQNTGEILTSHYVDYTDLDKKEAMGYLNKYK